MMLFDQVLQLNTLSKAWHKVRDNRGGPGGDNISIQTFNQHPLIQLQRLREDALNGTYWPAPLRRIEVPKKSGGWRPLSIPSVRDRVLQTATAQILTPIFEQEFESSSYGYRPNRSVGMAIRKVAGLRRAGLKWTVDADIKQFFDNVPHEKLIPKLSCVIEDSRLIDLICIWLEHSEPDGIGLPQGSPLSPLLANLHLDALDEAFEGKNAQIVRFADDFLILCKSENKAHQALQDAKLKLEELGLELNLEKTRIREYDESLNFLGRMFVRSIVLNSSENSDISNHKDIVRSFEPPPPEPDELLEPDSKTQTENHRLAPRTRTLYVYDAHAKLKSDGPHFTITKAGNEQLRLPTHRIDHIDIGPRADISASAIRLAAASETSLSFSDGWGHANARVEPATGNNAHLHLMQAQAVLNHERRIVFARKFVEGRLRNQRALLRRLNRRRKDENISEAATKLGNTIRRIPFIEDPQQLMGYEGQAAAIYWPAFGKCFERDWIFKNRERQPPPDPINLVLSFLSNHLTRDIGILVQNSGLHSGFGFLHATDDSGRDTLALDLIEIFRAPIAEGLTIYVFNNQILKPSDFETLDGRCKLLPHGLRNLIRTYENWLDRPIKSPFSDKEVLWRGLIEEQTDALKHSLLTGLDFDIYKMGY